MEITQQGVVALTVSLIWLSAVTGLGQLDPIFENSHESVDVAITECKEFTNDNKRNAASNVVYKAPVGYEIVADCIVDIAFDPDTKECTTAVFYVDREGDVALRESEKICGQKKFQRTSIFNVMVLAYISENSDTPGSYSCKITAQKATSYSCGWGIFRKITNGVEATPNEYPSMVGLVELSTGTIVGGAVIISSRYCLTTAHSVYGKSPRAYALLVGDHDTSTSTDSRYSQLYTMSRILTHPQYRQFAGTAQEENDIAILTVSSDIQFNRGVSPACLPFNSGQFVGSYVEAAGWGMTTFGGISPTRLRKTSLQIITNADCSMRRNREPIQAGKMCTFSPPRDTCTGDSGGGLYIRSNGRLFVVGLISYGGVCGSNIPSVNTRLTSYIPWISANTGIYSCIF